MRPLSVVSDLDEAISQACDEALAAGLEIDQIVTVINKALKKWEREALAEDLSSAPPG